MREEIKLPLKQQKSSSISAWPPSPFNQSGSITQPYSERTDGACNLATYSSHGSTKLSFNKFNVL